MNEPSDANLEAGGMTIFGEAENAKGEKKSVSLKVAHGYKVTYLASVSIVEFCLRQEGKSGYYTPSILIGTEFIESLEGSTQFQIS